MQTSITRNPIENALLMIDALEEAGSIHQFQHDPDMGHTGINDEVITWALEFIEQRSATE